ncbi:MAG: class I SAM-dependent methyltransferase [Thermotaleaceae bacterium]
MQKEISEKTIRRFNRISGLYKSMDRMVRDEWRRNLLSQVSGKVLEVGIGTGANLSFYPSDITSLTGVDFSKGMLRFANEKIEKNSFLFSIQLIEADIQKLPFADNTFDSIVSSCVFCSVPDPVMGLKELRRVCKPSGKIYMLEHMRSEDKFLGLMMDLLNPLTVRLWGANINRTTINNIESSGLLLETEMRLMGSIMRDLVVNPNKSS